MTILQDHYDDFSNMRFAVLSKALHADDELIREAVKVISRLETRPGRNFASEEPRYITPDVYIEKVGGEYRVILNEEGVPRLRISRFYREKLKGDGKDEASRYIKEKMNSAKWFINSVEQRQRSIYRVAEAIARLQREFLDRGADHLRPMCLRDVAQDIGVHESTVSRVTSGKYVHTPQGIFELKFFFSNSLDAAGGHDVATRAVKSRIEKLMSDEGTRSLSDNEIAARLAGEGIKIARRTVAKYRAQLGIQTQTKRKKMM
jgi:RNA polymerase sigma-54 factor